MKVKSKKELKEDVEYYKIANKNRYEAMKILQDENYKLEMKIEEMKMNKIKSTVFVGMLLVCSILLYLIRR